MNLASFTFDKTDLYVGVILAVLLGMCFLTVALLKRKTPTIESLNELAALSNTKGGIIILLLIMWFFTLTLTTSIALWAIVKGVDPQNGILILLFGMLSSGAWGNVNGALFKTMTGEDPKPPVGVKEVKQTVTSTTSSEPVPTIPEKTSVVTTTSEPAQVEVKSDLPEAKQ